MSENEFAQKNISGNAKVKKVLIYDVAAEKTGAATILLQYYREFLNNISVESVFVTSVMAFPENEHIKVIKLPWVKKSYFHRLFCDLYYIKRLIKKLKPDEIINLQNIALSGIRIPQTLYLHNAIPISDIDFDIRKERSLWVFKHIISKRIMSHLKYANNIIVQAEWIKKALVEKVRIDNGKILVKGVKPILEENHTRIPTNKAVFFYPANLCSYKNHACIIEACRRLKRQGIDNYEVIFTINPDKEANEMCKETTSEHLPINYVGLLNKQQMEETYRKATLLFTSDLETVGLPLIEAQLFDAPIIAVDLPYSKEAVGNYKNVLWFKQHDTRSLEEKMKYIIEL